MINKKHIADMARHITRHAKGLKDPRIMHPEREWVLGLAVALGIFTVTAAGSAFSYMKNKHPVAESTEGASEVPVYRESIVKDALKQLETRDREREALLSGMSLPEPVLPAPEASTTLATTTEVVASVTASSSEGGE